MNATNRDGRSPLHLAILAEEFAVADLLLRKGAPLSAKCKSGFEPVYYAFTRANIEIAQLLLGYTANIEAEDATRNRPLHNACIRGSLPHVELLSQKGASVDPRNLNGDRPLCLASAMGHADVVRALLDQGAALRSKFTTGPSHEDSPLCLAAKHGHVSVIEQLLMRGASVLQRDEHDWQPLRYAAFYAHPQAVEILLSHGATVSGGASSGWGFEITAHRIGFVNDKSITNERKDEVMRLLTNAEAREQKSSESAAGSGSPAIPPAVQRQTVPIELSGPNPTKTPVQTMHVPFLVPQLLATPEMTAESSRLPTGGNLELHGFQPYGTQAPSDVAVSKTSLVPQNQPLRYVEILADSQYHNAGGLPKVSMHAPSQAYYPAAYDHNLPVPILSWPAASYNSIPRQPTSPNSPAVQSQPMSSGYASIPANALAPTMTLGPDGLWRQLSCANPGVQRAPIQTDAVPSSATSVIYPNGVQELPP